MAQHLVCVVCLPDLPVSSLPSSPAAAPPAARMSPLFVVALLALLLGFQPLTTDLYLPALPLLAEQLQASTAHTQATFYAMILAFGCAQLVWGPLSDRWGRRPILLAGIALYTVAALGCTLAPHMQALIAWRSLQGAAMGAVVMAARAIVRDLYPPAEGAHVMSKALTGLGLLACSSTLIGSWLANHLGWRATMAALVVVGLLAGGLVALFFRESLRQPNPHALHPGRWCSNSLSILRNPTFLAFTATTTSSYCALVVLLTAAPFTFVQVLGWSSTQVAWLLSAHGAVYICGTIVCRHLLRRWGVRRTVSAAGAVALLCAALLVLLACSGVQQGLAYAAVCLLFPLTHGIQQSCGQSGAISGFAQQAGLASALNGCLMMAVAFVTGWVLGRSFNGTVYPLVFGMGLWCVAAALASWTLVRRHGTPPDA